jgi:hypothetical protein
MCPNANVPITTGASGLCVVDVDHGITCAAELLNWMQAHDMPVTYAVRTGRRPEFGVQLYYSGEGLKSKGWEKDGLKGDIRCSTGLVMAAGSIHPDSGDAYEVLWDLPLAPVPEYVKTLTPKSQTFDPATAVDDATADTWLAWLYEYAGHYELDLTGFEKREPNGWLLGIVCPWVNEHTTGAGSDSSTTVDILDGKIAFSCLHGTCDGGKHNTADFKAAMLAARGDYAAEPGADGLAFIGKGKSVEEVVEDWRTLFHSKDDILNCPEPSFIIDQWLAKQSITAIAAPVGQRKSLIALNIIHAVCTDRPLFNFLPVLNKPKRILYLCPEMGLISMSNRIKKAGLADALGDILFVRSMNLEGLELDTVPDSAMEGSLLVLDTAIRFMAGDENKSADTKDFSKLLFRTQQRQGPVGAIVVLYHSPKATTGAFDLNLENCLRGSGELGAAITDGHGTRIQDNDPDKRYASPSFISHVKSRDYEGVPNFEAVCDRETCLMTKIGEVGGTAVLRVKKGGNKSNADGLDVAAFEYVKAHKDSTVKQLVADLAGLKIPRKKTWVTEAHLAINKGRGYGVTVTVAS